MKKNHAHKFKRFTYKTTGRSMYMCVLDCNFTVATELALGKKAICWRCGKEFSMNSYSITLSKPHCEDCHVFKHESKDRRKNSRRETDKVSELVAVAAGDSVIDSLKSRMSSVTSTSSDKPASNPVEFKEYKEDDEDIL